MARRLRRSGAAGRPGALGVVAAAVLVAALVVTGRGLDVRGGARHPPAAASPVPGTADTTQAPSRLGCPALWPVLATSDHASYPAGHPSRPPPGARAVACYQTSAQAAGAGYAEAPLPDGAMEVGGVYLVPTGRAFRASCRQAAGRLGFAVPCPGLLPTAPPGAPPPRLCAVPATCRRGHALRFLQGGFVVPPGYVGAPGGFSALSVAATPTRDAAGGFALRCQDEHWIATPTVHRTQGVLAACVDDPQRSSLGGSVLLRWSEQGAIVVVSVLDWSSAGRWSDSSRWSEVNQRLAVAVADRTRLVAPAA
ncbi:MAG TPA: hypothetical protein VF486_27825 [Actinomycetes bacterium]